ncbi:MAG: flagellar M-ring protein FliF [Gammaproteobacteria bacterium]|nr:flagellar M-ring protein FliF [Gammaproteobacteria bacterium]
MAQTAQGFGGLPALRQMGLMIGLAASVALGVAVALWSQTPTYSLLYGSLSQRDAAEVTDALQKSNIPFKIDETSGALMVASTQLQNARMKLAADGLPKGTNNGFEMLSQDQGFGTSQFVEAARYQHALEGELAQTISSLRNVESARVHLALPKRSVFLRQQEEPTASVVLNLYSGRTMDDGEVASIVHLVASSVPHLGPNQVTVVDQQGHLLTARDSAAEAGMTSSQFAYNRKVEGTYIERVENLLSPLVGGGKVRAQVAAELDFTVTEKTQEVFNPDLPALRSEQTSEEQMSSNVSGMGVPGTLSNTPPAAGTTTPPAAAAGAAAATPAAGAVATGGESNGNSSKRSTRNFELDKTISHTRLASGEIRRLSVAVVLDDKETTNDQGETTRAAWKPEELAKFTTLVKEAIGFNAQRGDSVQVINAAFQPVPVEEPLPEPAIWEQPWMWDVLKQVAGAIAVLLLIFGVLKPTLRSLTEKGAAVPMMAGPGGEAGIGEEQVSIGGMRPQGSLPGPQQYEQQITTAKGMIQQDPKRVAQVVKNWVNEDG